jgi:hypothetical protein
MNRARSCDLDGLTYWTIGRGPGDHPRPTATIHLLPIYDEYLVAYRDHRVVPRPAYVLGNFQHALVSGGQVAGTWRTTLNAKGVAISAQTLRRLTPVERRALTQAVARYRRFLGLPVSLSVT